ncbi:MAG: ferritin family protein [Deltaproteobacteria bacterium]|nr:ferritin family protein [Deltaproteobacteria bacterium]
MKQFESVNELLDFAIKEEEGAAAFYSKLASKMDRPWMKKIFEDFAKEELGHKAKLVHIKDGGAVSLPKEKVLNLKLGDYLVVDEPSDDMDYQQALVLAMKKEKSAFRLYSDLAEVAEDEALRDLLLGLAQEEAKHKLRFEVEYDDQYMKEN